MMIIYENMLSFDSGKEVAIVCGGAHDEQKIYIKLEETEEPERDAEDEYDVFDILDDDDFKQSNYKNYSMKEKVKIAQALIDASDDKAIKHFKLHTNDNDDSEEDEELQTKMADMHDKLHFRLKKEFELSSGIMIPIPDRESERI